MKEVKTQRIFIDLNATGRNNSINIQPNTVGTDQSTRDKLLPNGNSVSWPFIYLGMWVFSFQNYLSLENSTTATTLTLGFVLRFFLIAFFTVGLLLLVIANIMRIGILRIFIIGSPFLILMQVFNKKAWTWWLSKIFNFNNLVATVFKPVIFVAGISLMLIVIVSMQNSITWSWATRENDLNGASLSIVWDSTSVLDIPGISNISINQKDILGKDVLGQNVAGKTKNFFSHLIMLLLTLFLMREFIKISLTIGWWTISDTMEWLLKQAENMAKSTPIVPFKWSAASFNTLQSFSKQQSNAALLKWFGVNKEGRFAWAEEAFQTKVDTWMWVQPSWTGKDYNELTSLANSFESAKYTNFFARSTELAKERKWWLSITNPSWIAAMQTLLSNPWKFDAINKWLGENKFEWPWTTAYKTPEKYFKWKNATALYKIMWWAAAAKWSSTPTDYASLAKITFYPGEQ